MSINHLCWKKKIIAQKTFTRNCFSHNIERGSHCIIEENNLETNNSNNARKSRFEIRVFDLYRVVKTKHTTVLRTDLLKQYLQFSPPLIKVYMTLKIISAYLKGLSKYRKMASFFLISFFVLEKLTFFYYANLIIDDVILFATRNW